jgi:hypothetical protein
MNLPIIKILIIAGLIVALAITAGISPPQSQAQAMGIGEQNQVIEQQISPLSNATATITITMTGVEDAPIMK